MFCRWDNSVELSTTKFRSVDDDHVDILNSYILQPVDAETHTVFLQTILINKKYYFNIKYNFI